MAVTQAIPITRHPYADGSYKKMLIDGKWVDAASGKKFETHNPATGELLATVAEGDAEDINRAVAAARRVLGPAGPGEHRVAGIAVHQEGVRCVGEADDLERVELQRVVARAGEIDDLDIVGLVDDGIGNRLADPDLGDLGDDVVQAFDMLNVERGVNVDAVA